MIILGCTFATMLSGAIEWLRHLSISEIISNFLKAKFPHTSARILHMLYLLSDVNLELYDRRDFLVAILPLYLLHFHEYIRVYYSGTWTSESLLGDIVASLVFLYCLVYFYDSLYAIGLIFGTSTLWGKLICAFDLWLESVCVFSFHLAFAIFVRAVLDQFFGWPTAQWMYYVVSIELRIAWQDFRDEMRRALQQ